MARPLKTAAPTAVVGYIRVSTAKQSDHGVSLDAQRAKLEAYAALYDLHLVDIIVDAGYLPKPSTDQGCSRPLGCCRPARPVPCW